MRAKALRQIMEGEAGYGDLDFILSPAGLGGKVM